MAVATNVILINVELWQQQPFEGERREEGVQVDDAHPTNAVGVASRKEDEEG
ncbi:MAG: hypothetical protein KME08_17350 [Aphanothece sp. CMT-3BRIN-NPC111]|jgi:hypothetical protein|nr:hypothetical protein [Aphanothece sp. CMT-3BRIN-NPC111]